MSISGSQEVKTAILRVDGTTSGNTEQTQLDAQEDREIVGVDIAANPALDGEIQAAYRCFIGTDPLPAQDEANDNRSFMHQTFVTIESDDTNGVGSVYGGDSSLWFGHGSGVEWNEDATLTFEIVNTAGSSSATSAHVTVYYREL